MAKQRPQRVAEEIKREISQIISKEMKDPRVEDMTSVTGVEITGELNHAKVFVSVYASEESREKSLLALKKGAGFIRTELGQRLRLRHVPEISFHLDTSMEYGEHINKILKDLDEGKDDDIS